MKSMFWLSIVSAAALGGSACKKSETEKAQDKYEKAQEKVQDKAEDVRDQAKDVQKADTMSEKRDEQKDVNAAQHDLNNAKADLAAARVDFTLKAKERLSQIDTQIHELEAKGTAKAKESAAKLREERNVLAAKLDRIGDQTDAGWDAFKTDVNTKFDALEASIKRDRE